MLLFITLSLKKKYFSRLYKKRFHLIQHLKNAAVFLHKFAMENVKIFTIIHVNG
jgi:hypothetical protein